MSAPRKCLVCDVVGEHATEECPHGDGLEESPKGYARGDRVRLVSTADPYTKLAPGTLGIVTLVDDLGTVHVNWDDGSRLGMVEEAGDRIERLGHVARPLEEER